MDSKDRKIVMDVKECQDCKDSCNVLYKTYEEDNTVVYRCYECAFGED